MVTIPSFKRVTLPLATVVAAAGASLVALAFLVMPGSLLERLVSASGFPSILAAAEPPLGFTARIALALFGGGLAAACLWYASYLAVGFRTISLGGTTSAIPAAIRRADAHPDAPPRAPLLANRDLGTPFLDIRAVADPGPAAEIEFDPPPEQPLPLDLERPMADFDPHAMLADPLPLPLPVKQLSRPAAALRVETLAPAPAREAPSLRHEPVAAATENTAPLRTDPQERPPRDATIRDLLARLEKGVAKESRGPVQAASLSAALGELRRLALENR